MRSAHTVLLAAAFIVFAAASPRAALDFDQPITTAGGFELIVMEAPGCTYCGLFRRDVLPSFRASESGKKLPVRFLDVNDLEQAKLDLKSPVQIVPTFVLARGGKEIGRIPGYVGPEMFFRSISYLMSAAP